MRPVAAAASRTAVACSADDADDAVGVGVIVGVGAVGVLDVAGLLADGPAVVPAAAPVVVDEHPAAHSSASTVPTRPVERRTSSPDLVMR
ncbi:hypothetical protein [Kitasatospora sp. NPDC058218]|uniref:hypothetical protein n=1 Tax=Kitasatospora sp. NPDC058218 TaxID=3346385 RepID=UPI0036D793BE